MKQTMAVDMDEVIADAGAKMRDSYYREYGILIGDEDIIGLDLKEAVVPEHAGAFHRYLNTPGFFRDLELMPGAREVLERLNQKFELYLVSAAMEFPNSLPDKFDWIMDKLPFIGWRQVCLCGSKKIIQTDIMIDDRPRNFASFLGRKLLYSAHHNIREEGFERVDNWEQVAQKLL